MSSIMVKEFAHYGDETTTVYRTDAVKWALSREDKHNLAYINMRSDASAIFAVALGIDGEVDAVMVDENNTNSLEDLDRAIAALTRAREQLAQLLP